MNDLLFSPGEVLDSLNDGVYVCDRDRRIVYWSKTAERITGWQSEDVLGRLCLEDVLSHVDKDGNRLCGEEHCPLHRAMVTGVTTRVPMIVFALGKDGSRVPMHVITAPIRNAAGEVIGAVETFRDVSPLLMELERAKTIQTRTLELDLPDDSRVRLSSYYIPNDIVGGDYYAIKHLDADRYGFLLADMEGHGMVAALYTMHLSILWDRYYPLLKNPMEFATALNNELVRVLGSVTSFATAFCGVIDVSNGTLRLTGAGGPAPLIMDASGSVEMLKSSGMPFGFMEDVPYQEQTAQLEPGDSLLLFSDGAFEIHNVQDELLGVDGFVQILKSLDYPKVEISGGGLTEALLKFSNDIRLEDDITIIEARFLGEHASR
jgi:PAS domain S-box-containing protein